MTGTTPRPYVLAQKILPVDLAWLFHRLLYSRLLYSRIKGFDADE